MKNLEQKLSILALNPLAFTGFTRGIERETLRYQKNGKLALTEHPSALGSALANGLITTDFSESLLEFITPVSQNIDETLGQLEDIHHFAQKQMKEESMWPLSMPCFVDSDDIIPLAYYGESNIGKMKTLYREGLKNRYGALMQIISGVHFNFSFPTAFWQGLHGELDETEMTEQISASYFHLIRNYYRSGWLIPYFFGASPALCQSFLKNAPSTLKFQCEDNTLYLPYSTSLRLSDLGYTSAEQNKLSMNFNDLEGYLHSIAEAMKTPSQVFSQIGENPDGSRGQLNSNVLQIENELYAPIRPKRVTLAAEKPSQALARAGVEYVEVRALDINPFSPIGIDAEQIRFLDLFMVWCVLSKSPDFAEGSLACCKSNWSKVVLEGRKPDLMLSQDCGGSEISLNAWGKTILADLSLIATYLDEANQNDEYQKVCQKLMTWLESPNLTLSGQMLEQLLQSGGSAAWGAALGERYFQTHLEHSYKEFSDELLIKEAQESLKKQTAIEASDELSFDAFLSDYFRYLNPSDASDT